MTRQHSTKDEDRIKTVFIEYLKSSGKEVKVDESIKDRPDIGLYVDGDFVGCEITAITLSEFEKWVKKESSIGEFRTISLDNLPNKWMKSILDKKVSKDYRSEHNFKFLWLIIHTRELPLFGNDEFTLQMLRYVVNNEKHEFDKVWFVGEKNQVELLWPIKSEHAKKQTFKVPQQIIYKKVKIDASKGGRIGIDFNNESIINDK